MNIRYLSYRYLSFWYVYDWEADVLEQIEHEFILTLTDVSNIVVATNDILLNISFGSNVTIMTNLELILADEYAGAEWGEESMFNFSTTLSPNTVYRLADLRAPSEIDDSAVCIRNG